MVKTLLTNARFYGGHSWAVVEGDSFTAFGCGPVSVGVDQTVDLEGHYVLPGLHEAHIHMKLLGQDLLSLDCRYVFVSMY